MVIIRDGSRSAFHLLFSSTSTLQAKIKSSFCCQKMDEKKPAENQQDEEPAQIADDDKDKMSVQEEIELQLHKQFAQNYNSTFGSIVSVFVALLAVLSGYGYIFLHSNVKYSYFLNELCDKHGTFSLDALIFATIACVFVLDVMRYLCAYLGSNQRMEQFIAFAIRVKHYGANPTKLQDGKIFPSSYHPFRKYNEKFIVGIYGQFLKILCCMRKVVFFGVLIKIVCNVILMHSASFSWTAFIEIVLLIFVMWYCCKCYQKKYKDMLSNYKKRQKEYEIYFKQKHIEI